MSHVSISVMNSVTINCSRSSLFCLMLRFQFHALIPHDVQQSRHVDDGSVEWNLMQTVFKWYSSKMARMSFLGMHGRLEVTYLTLVNLCWRYPVEQWGSVTVNYPQWGTADAEIKDLSVENPELKGSPFKSQEQVSIEPSMLLPGISFQLISTLLHSPAFVPKPLPMCLLWWLVANTGFDVGPQDKIGRPARHNRQLMPLPVLSARWIWLISSKTCVIVSACWHFDTADILLTFWERLVCFMKFEVCCVGLFVK